MAETWAWLLERDTASPWILDVAIPMAITNLVYWVVGMALLAVDCSSWWWWRSIKCQKRAPPLPWRDVKHICLVVGAQFATLYPLTLWLAAPLMRARLQYTLELPSLTTTLLSFVGFAFASEVYFYHAHYLLHHPRLYPYVHKLHHAYTAPIALESLYFHPIESVLQLGTVAFGPLLLGAHVTLLYVWIVVTLFNVVLHHCGHEVPLDELPHLGSMTHQHDYHHKCFNCNFGVLGLCDWLYGTRGGFDTYHAMWVAGRAPKELWAEGFEAAQETVHAARAAAKERHNE